MGNRAKGITLLATIVTLAACGGGGGSGGSSSSSPSNNPAPVPNCWNAPDAEAGSLIVRAHPSSNLQDVSDALLSISGGSVKNLSKLDASVIKPEGNLALARQYLFATGLFEVVEVDSLAVGGGVPNDPSYPSQWHLSKIQAGSAWDRTTGSAAHTIAVIDSGIDPTHPDLATRLVPGWNFLGNNTDTHDVLGHGTAVAGTLGAATNNAAGVAGVTWNNPIMPLVVLNNVNYASYSNIAAAIIYAADRGVKVINISIGGTVYSQILQDAVDYAWASGAVIVACAMNDSTNTPYYPAACDKVIAVGSTDSADNLSGFSNHGMWIDVVAPGSSILTTANGGGYGYVWGTSFAAPITAGIAALTLDLNPGMDPGSVVGLLRSSVDDLGTTGFDSTFGWGRVNAFTAVVNAPGWNTTSSDPIPVITAPT